MANTASLISKLLPDRNYGERSYDEVVQDVKDGILTIHEGETIPILRDATTGLTVRGTGVPERKNTKQSWHERFVERAISDFPDVYDSLVRSAHNGDSRALIYFFDRLMGSPARQLQVQTLENRSLFIELLSGSRMATVKDMNDTGTTIDSTFS